MALSKPKADDGMAEPVNEVSRAVCHFCGTDAGNYIDFSKLPVGWHRCYRSRYGDIHICPRCAKPTNKVACALTARA